VARRQRPGRGRVPKDDRLFTLQVCIVSGPMTKKIVTKNKVICGTIQMRGDQALEDLRDAIFDAFKREEQHIDDFRVGGKEPMDPKRGGMCSLKISRPRGQAVQSSPAT
jgi:hypothetical protein